MNRELLEQIDNMIERLAIIELHTGESKGVLIDKRTLLDIQKELELQAIKEANPSEALECLERIRAFLSHRTKEMSFQDLRDIEQALIKAQEQEKENKSYKLALKNINKLIADAYNSKMSFELAVNCINEILKEVDWRDKDEVK